MSDIEWSHWIQGDGSEAESLGAEEIEINIDEPSVGIDDATHYRIPMSDYKRITGMPEWSEAPKWAQWLAQDEDGLWCGFSVKPESCQRNNRWVIKTHDTVEDFGTGNVLGDWRDTLQERPSEALMTVKAESFRLGENDQWAKHFMAERAGGSLDTHPDSEPAEERTSEGAVSMADQYPAYYKDVSGVSEVDVYAVHQLFGVDDPSGCIHHASKKLLLSGARTGGKSKRDDIREARDTLTRWLDLNHE